MSLSLQLLHGIAATGLAGLGLAYERLADGTLYWRGTRPGPDWHAHGLLRTRPLDLRRGHLVALRVAKQRWKHRHTGETVHSVPPDDLGKRYTALVIAIALFAWLDVALGVHRHERPFHDLDRIDPRTLQRWLRRARPGALQQGVRTVLLDLGHPPETLFPRGLPPPPLGRHAWRDPAQVCRLHRGLAMALRAALGLNRPAAMLLGDARRKTLHEPFLID